MTATPSGRAGLGVLSAAVWILLSGCTPPDPGRPTTFMHSRHVAARYAMSQVRMYQMLAREQKVVDQDKDGIPEFCLLGELSGELVPRGRTSKIPFTKLGFLPSGYHTGGSAGKGYCHRKGYFFRIYLARNIDQAGDDRTLGGTQTSPGPAVPPDAINLQERHFALYAWPSPKGIIPKYAQAFFMNESGRIFVQEGTSYIGPDKTPPAESAYAGHVFTSDIDTSKWKPLLLEPPKP